MLAEQTCKSAALSQRAHYASRLRGVGILFVLPNATPSLDHVQGLGREGIGSGVLSVPLSPSPAWRQHHISGGIPDMEL